MLKRVIKDPRATGYCSDKTLALDGSPEAFSSCCGSDGTAEVIGMK